MINNKDDDSDVDKLEVIFENDEEQDGEQRRIVSLSNYLIRFPFNQQ